MKIVNLIIICVASVMLCGCGEYQKAQKSKDADYKLVYRIDPVSEGILQLPGFPNTYTQEGLLLRN